MSSGGRVLVVDDEQTVCLGVERILAKANMDVTSTYNADDALDMMEQKEFDLVITDLMMPKISGMELLARIKRHRPDVSVVMITGYATYATAVTAIKLGAFDYVPKPFTPNELTSVSLRAVERARWARSGSPTDSAQDYEVPIVAGLEAPEPDEEYTRLSEGARVFVMREHSWARIEADGNVRIGAEDVFQRTAGKAIYIDLPNEGDNLTQGQICVHVTTPGLHIHKLWSPITGEVIRINPLLADDSSLLNTAPRGLGWIIRVKPIRLKKDLKQLIEE